MSLSMAPLLMPLVLRFPRRSATPSGRRTRPPAEHRSARLRSAAFVIHQTTGLDCSDVRELVGLPGDGDCA